MRGRPRRRESPTLWVVSARRVWRMLHCVNPNPAGLSRDPNGRWLLTLGPAPKAAFGMDDLNHRCWQTLTTRAKTGRKGNLKHVASQNSLEMRDHLNRKQFLHGDGFSVVPDVGL